ncbi:MAG: FtsQ-type POTRA domain-containing protein, partial [Alphaproteobacteria bacterium]|nr:FtsQ-type POTRA domain-containing protein [Alphaproteobacteria bacterium]
MTKKYERETLGDLFQNAEIRREALAAATGEARLDKATKPPLPAWRRWLAAQEQRVAGWPWIMIGRSVALVGLLAVGTWGWEYRAWLNDKVTTTIAEATGATVQKIEVTGLVHTGQAELLKALGLGRGSSLVGFDAGAARQRIEALPWVRLASVERQLPATVRVRIYEHTPLARIISGSSVVVLNQQGEAVIDDTTNAFVGLPLLQGDQAPQQAASLFAHLQPHPQLLGQLREATWVGNRRWDLRFVSGVTV